ncbi:hypothetical protein s21009500007_000004 [Ehrlichia canis]|nr:hypothetical protein [Ehrlichia canis]UKC52963.1 hypothetical protein s20019040002_000004 [Ehrlichia canis]UKC53900.1 hypothetical protein s20026770001_000004 [Ehrlichia canis]UKC54836.1 hypothetical protein s21009500007_000004 [Ehrlichia canis]
MIYKHNKKVMQTIQHPTIDSTDLRVEEASDDEEYDPMDRDLLYCDEEGENVRGVLDAQTTTDEGSNDVPPSTHVNQETSHTARVEQIDKATQTQETLNAQEEVQVNKHTNDVGNDTNESLAPIVNISREGLAGYSRLLEEVVDDKLNLTTQNPTFAGVGSSLSNTHDVTQKAYITERETEREKVETEVKVQETLSVKKTEYQGASSKFFNDIGSNVSKDLPPFVNTTFCREALNGELSDIEMDDDSDSCLLYSGMKKKVPYFNADFYAGNGYENASGAYYSYHVSPDSLSTTASARGKYDGVFAQAIEEGLERISSGLQNKSIGAAQGDSIKDCAGDDISPVVRIAGNECLVGNDDLVKETTDDDDNSKLVSLNAPAADSNRSGISVLSDVNPVANYTAEVGKEYVAKNGETNVSQSGGVIFPNVKEHVSFNSEQSGNGKKRVSFSLHPTIFYYSTVFDEVSRGNDGVSEESREKYAVKYEQEDSTTFSLSTSQEHLKDETSIATGQDIVDCDKTTENYFVSLPNDVSTVQGAANDSETNIHKQTTLIDVVERKSLHLCDTVSLGSGSSKTMVVDSTATASACGLVEKSSIENATATSTSAVSTPEMRQELRTSVVESSNVSQKFVEPVAFDSGKESSSSAVPAEFSSESIGTATVKGELPNEAVDQSMSTSLNQALVPYAVGAVVDTAGNSFDTNMFRINEQLSDVLPSEKTTLVITYGVDGGSKNTFVCQVNHNSITSRFNLSVNEIGMLNSRNTDSGVDFVERFLQPRFPYGLQQRFSLDQLSMLYPRHANPDIIGSRAGFLQPVPYRLQQRFSFDQLTMLYPRHANPDIIGSRAGFLQPVPYGLQQRFSFDQLSMLYPCHTNPGMIGFRARFLQRGLSQQLHELQKTAVQVCNFDESITTSVKPVAAVNSISEMQRELPIVTDSHLASSSLSQEFMESETTVCSKEGFQDRSAKPIAAINSAYEMQSKLPIMTGNHLASSNGRQELILSVAAFDLAKESSSGYTEENPAAIVSTSEIRESTETIHTAGSMRQGLVLSTTGDLAKESSSEYTEENPAAIVSTSEIRESTETIHTAGSMRQGLVLSTTGDLGKESSSGYTEENPAAIVSTSEIRESTETIHTAGSMRQGLVLSTTEFGIAKVPDSIDTSKNNGRLSSVLQDDDNNIFGTVSFVTNEIKSVCVNKVKSNISFISNGFDIAVRKGKMEFKMLYPHAANPNIGDRAKFLQPRLSIELQQQLSKLQKTAVQAYAVDQGIENLLSTSTVESIDTTEMNGQLFDEPIYHLVDSDVNQKLIKPTSPAVFDLEEESFMENASAKPTTAIIDMHEIQKKLPTGTDHHLASSSVSKELMGSTISGVFNSAEISNGQTCEAVLTEPVVERVTNTTKDDMQYDDLPLIDNRYELVVYNLIEERKAKGNVTVKSSSMIIEQEILLVDCYDIIRLSMKDLKMDFVDISSVELEDVSLLFLERGQLVTKKLLLSIIKNISPIFVRVFSGGDVSDNEWKLLEMLLNDRRICENFYVKRILCYYAVIIEYAGVLNKEYSKLLDRKLKIGGKIERKRAEIDRAIVNDGKPHGKFSLSKFKPSVATLKKELSELNSNFGSNAILLSECEEKIKQLKNERVAFVNNDSDYMNSLVSCIIGDFDIYDDRANNVVKNCYTIGNFISKDIGEDLEMLVLVLKCSVVDSSGFVKNIILRMKQINSKKAALLNTEQTRGMLLGVATTNGYEVVSACGSVRSV